MNSLLLGSAALLLLSTLVLLKENKQVKTQLARKNHQRLPR